MTSSGYAPRPYWEERLGADFNLGGVGFRKRGLKLNMWMYRSKLQALNAALIAENIDLRDKVVCEVGCGTGFYVPFWLSHEPRRLVGWDITSVSVMRLRDQYPQAYFQQRDISQPLTGNNGESFDLVASLDVLYHITDAAAFNQAISNLGRITTSGGRLVITDYAWKYGTVKSKAHVRYH